MKRRFMEVLAKTFTLRGVQYALLHGLKDLDSEGGDIDIVVDRERILATPNSVLEAAAFCGLRVVKIIQHEAEAWAAFIADPLRPEDMFSVDWCGTFTRNGYRFIENREMLCKIARSGEFNIVAPEIEFKYRLCKGLQKRKRGDSLVGELGDLYRQDPNNCLKAFESVVGKNCNSMEEVRDMLERKYDSLSTGLKQRHAFSLKDWAFEACRLWSRIVRPAGLFVVVLGVDGAGKSSVIQKLGEQMEPLFKKNIVRHFRPGTSSGGDAVDDPHGAIPRPWSVSFLKLIYYWLDWWRGYLMSDYLFLVRNGWLIYDRYAHDLAVDPRRFRIARATWLSQRLWKWTPQPDLVLLLDAPTSILRARKQEVSEGETERQSACFRSMMADVSKGHHIDASGSLDQVVASCRCVILNYLSFRVSKNATMYG